MGWLLQPCIRARPVQDVSDESTAGPSTALRSARDDKLIGIGLSFDCAPGKLGDTRLFALRSPFPLTDCHPERGRGAFARPSRRTCIFEAAGERRVARCGWFSLVSGPD